MIKHSQHYIIQFPFYFKHTLHDIKILITVSFNNCYCYKQKCCTMVLVEINYIVILSLKKSQEGEPRLFGHWHKISPYWVLYKTWTPVIFYICFPHLQKSTMYLSLKAPQGLWWTFNSKYLQSFCCSFVLVEKCTPK